MGARRASKALRGADHSKFKLGSRLAAVWSAHWKRWRGSRPPPLPSPRGGGSEFGLPAISGLAVGSPIPAFPQRGKGLNRDGLVWERRLAEMALPG